ncbi:hypothetical protein [Burkholderia sp. Ac-20365]|uniref:hypothetical protein n=1 Tax=Burkholderia sp. Ac-20365 TaxID=2703897 RepID=UPI00197BFD34|nr:hypothetical protein [Burkholderia sp. Ac-20365]MBN3761102.1 hypothetical protein [Burkholderia sp. Ac-20365]
MENGIMEVIWREFDDGEEWFAGRPLWVWARSWKRPRLVVGSIEDGCECEWAYTTGEKLGGEADFEEEFPTHCSDPFSPPPPAV